MPQPSAAISQSIPLWPGEDGRITTDVELRVRPRIMYDANVGGNSAINSVHARVKVLKGNIEEWDFTMLLFALLNSAACQVQRGGLTWPPRWTTKAGVRRVRNEAFGHVESTQLPWPSFCEGAAGGGAAGHRWSRRCVARSNAALQRSTLEIRKY
jgi:hypothetical protein